MGTALAMVHNLEGLVFFSAIIWGTHVARSWLRTPAVVRAIDRVTGTVLVGFGVALAARPASLVFFFLVPEDHRTSPRIR